MDCVVGTQFESFQYRRSLGGHRTSPCMAAKGWLVRDSIADFESLGPVSTGWPASIGMGGRLPSESVAGLHRNQWPASETLRDRANGAEIGHDGFCSDDLGINGP